MRIFFSFIFTIFLAYFWATVPLLAASPHFFTDHPEKVMLNGRDVISYYTHPFPQAGCPAFHMEYQGVKWYFYDRLHLHKFQKNPEMYVPAFGGYCVWALAHGRLAKGDPSIYRIVDGKLYLFCSEASLQKWMSQRELINRIANEHWPEILDQ